MVLQLEVLSLAMPKYGVDMDDIFCRQAEENGWAVTDSIDQLDIGQQLDDRSYALDVICIHINTTNNDAEQDTLEAATNMAH
jgi:hypothetical protein